MSFDPHRVLIIGPAWVGDVVMAQVAFKLLRQQFPEIEIDVVGPSWALPLFKRMDEIHRTIELSVAHGEWGWRKRHRLGKTLRQSNDDNNYDWAIVFPRSFKSALVPFFAQVPKRTGFKSECRHFLLTDRRTLDQHYLDMTIKRMAALVWPSGQVLPAELPSPQLRVDSARAAALVDKFKLTASNRVLGLLPGAAFGPAKQWPVEHYVELADQLRRWGWEVWVFGSRDEYALGEAIVGDQSSIRNLCGKTSLDEVVDLLSLCRVVVSNDSGLMHIAAAVGCEVHALYGSSSPSFTPPLTTNAKIHYLGIECSPCFARTCRFGHTRCLREISVTQVAESILVSD